jgi:soluble P-type ATPase
MIELAIPGFGQIVIKHLVVDYSGTLSVDGLLLEGVKDRLNRLAELIDVHVVSADTHGKVKSQLVGVSCQLVLLFGENQDVQKLNYVENLGAENVVAIGNGNNDRKMLSGAAIGIAVCINEGASVDAIKAAKILANSPLDALDLLIYPDRLKATLRF